MSEIAIRVNNLSKCYQIGRSQSGEQQFGYRSLREVLAGTLTEPMRRIRGLIQGEAYAATDMNETLWALKDISFEIKQGEVVGIIGRNGAGKSTLLKILSRITEPTHGEATIYGRVGSLLEVGTGFHPELTGRENIYLNGAILGMKRAGIMRQFDEIVAFAEVEKFIDTPVKHYSSGMYLRLAFAVAAHLEPEILMVDEVLAVGDAEFQKKCLNKMENVAQTGRTVLFVSHNIGAIATLCTQAVLLEDGQISIYGAVNDAIASYLSGPSSANAKVLIEPPSPNEGLAVQSVVVSDHEHNNSSELDYRFPFNIEIEFEVYEPTATLSLWIRLNNIHGIHVVSTWLTFRERFDCGRYSVVCQVPGELLAPSKYSLDIEAIYYGVKLYHYAENCLSFNIKNTNPRFNANGTGWGVIFPQLPCKVEQL